MRLVKHLLALGLMIMPFVFWEKAEIRYEIPRVVMIEWWIKSLVIGAAGAIFLGKQKVKWENSNKLFFWIWLWLAVVILSGLLGGDVIKSIFGNYYRRDGLLTLFHLVGLGMAAGWFYRRDWQRVVLWGVGLGMAGVSFWTVYEAIKLGFMMPVGVSFGQPNFLAGYLLIGLPLIDYLAKMEKNRLVRIFWKVGLLVQTTAIVATYSEMGILGIGLFWGLNQWLTQKQKLRRWLAVGGLITILGYGLSGLNRGEINNQNPEDRRRIWVKTFLGAVKRPILGYGWANVDLAFEQVDWPYAEREGYKLYVDKAHSHLLEMLTVSGVVGLTLYIMVVSRMVRIFYRDSQNSRFKKALLMSLLLYLIQTQVNVVSVAEEVWFWVMAGIAGQDS
ncbi:MAG: O-antigen ligase family protein [Patescibacteria group bacterium]|nr:O-antigen ligase family protein [Patescibacteria group bacterium]